MLGIMVVSRQIMTCGIAKCGSKAGSDIKSPQLDITTLNYGKLKGN